MAAIAFDLVDGTNQNLDSFTVTTSGGNDPATWSPGDWFGVAAYGSWPQSAGVPFGIADDSVFPISGSVFAPDTQGLIDSTTASTDTFFSAIDLVNDSNPGGSATATWEFDINNVANLMLSIDMAAMGDFESSNDSYVWSYSIDGGAFQDIFVGSVDEAGSQTYTMESGATPTLDDPLVINGVTLNDEFQTLTEAIMGTGSTLTLQVFGTSDGGSEAYAAQHILIEGGLVSSLVAAEDFDGNAVNLISSFDPATDNLDGGGGDFFGVGSRNAWPQSAGVPFSLADDSVFDYSGGGVFTGDAEGVFGQNSDLDNDFFGVSDSDEFGGDQTASWTFDIAGFTDLALQIDMGGISDSSFGGFAADTDAVFSVQIDGGATQTAFDLNPLEANGFTTRPMDSGAPSGGGRVLEVAGDNPVMKLLAEDDSEAANTFLDKAPASGAGAGELDTFMTAINGTGSTLTLTFDADFPFEAMAFDNIQILGTPAGLPALSLTADPASFAEDETSTVTVTRPDDTTSGDLEVNLLSSDADEAAIPETVIIPAGETSVTFIATGVDDMVFDGDQSVTLKASATGFSGGATSVTVTDISSVPEVAIFDIQGAGHDSPVVGQFVLTRGIVTAVASDGFYLQDAAGDGNIATSDGIFVEVSNAGVAVGDSVEVTGTVSEEDPSGSGADLDITTLLATDTVVLASGNALPAPIILGSNGRPVPTENINDDAFASFDPTTDGADFFESLEGMRVTAQDVVAVAGTNRFGEIFTVTDQAAGATGISDRGTLNISPDDFNPDKVQIDTDSTVSGFDNPAVNAGDTLGDVTGVISYDFGNFQIVPTEDFTANVQAAGLQPETTTLAGDDDKLTVATYNVLNLDPVVEVQANTNNGEARNVDDDLGDGRFDAIAQQIVNNLNTPDVIGLQEVQDNTGGEIVDDVIAADVTLQTLVDAIAAAGGPQYEFIDNPFITDEASGGQPGGNIRTAFLYNPDRVSVVDGSVQTIGGQGPGEAFQGARLPLIADFTFNGETVTIVNNHFSSKGGSAPIVGLEQPFEARQEDVTVNGSLDERQAQSNAVQDFVSGILANDSGANVVVLGDLNEFEFVSPVTELETDAGLNNLTNTLPEDERYTFIFQGNSQSLDHILVSDSLQAGAEVDVVHVNAEFTETPQRASDHDPIVASLDLGDVPPTTFTLELLHAADQEAGALAVQDAPRFSAVLNALEAQDLGDDGMADNTLKLSSGDAFIPGLFYDASGPVFGSGGIADIQIQNELGFQAIALGNHEFDFGTAELAGLIDGSAPGEILGTDFTGADFPYLATNLDFSSDANLAPLEVEGGQAPQANTVTSSVVIDVNGENIGVVGAVTPTLGSISNPGDVGISPSPFDANPTPEQLDALAVTIQTEVDALLAADPTLNKIVLLAHQQQLSIERALAERLENVDIIVAGGSNTRLFDANDRPRDGDSVQGQYPEFITNAGGTQTAVVNTDGSYKYVGRLVLDFDAQGNIIPASYDETVSGAYATDDQGVADLNAENLVDPEIQQIVDAIEAQIIATEGNVFGIADVFLNGNRSGTDSSEDPDGVRTQETNLGNLTADANLVEAQAEDPTVVLSIKNGGGIRASIGQTVVPPGGTEPERLPNEAVIDGDGNVVKPEGGISQNDIQTTLAFNNGLTLLTLTKAELVAVLEHGVSALPDVSGRFPQIAGVKFSYDPDLAVGDRILSAGIFDENDNLVAELVRDGELVGDATEAFRIVTLDFLAAPRFDDNGAFVSGGDGYPFPNTNTDPAVGEVADPAVLARINPVALQEEGVQTGDAIFADDGTEQDALAEFLFDNFLETPFDEADTGRNLDERIQNLNFRDDTVLPDVAVAPFEVVLIDADTDAVITPLVDGSVIDDSLVEGRNLTLAAFIPEASPLFGEVGSVQLDFNNGDEIGQENIEPYALFGDDNQGDFFGGDFDLLTENSLTLTVFEDRGLRGEQLDEVTIDFTVDRDPVVGNLVTVGLFDAATDTLIETIEDGDIIAVTPDQSLTISVSVAPEDILFGQVESVFLDLNNGETTRRENAEPYALFGDNGHGNLRGGNIPTGDNTIELDFFSKNNLNGDLLDTLALDFTLIESV
ncbi:MAG: 5'-nucleotidase C-terminal domain-containing protein [Cyanobacteria bacterium J06559_3]